MEKKRTEFHARNMLMERLQIFESYDIEVFTGLLDKQKERMWTRVSKQDVVPLIESTIMSTGIPSDDIICLFEEGKHVQCEEFRFYGTTTIMRLVQ